MKHCCWWCTLEIQDKEYNLPYKLDTNGKYHVMGKFCSWECVKTYNLKENRLKFGNIQGYIMQMRRHMYGKIIPLQCAPERYFLQKFGGPMSEQEFRSHLGKPPPILRMPETANFIHEPIKNEKYEVKKSSRKDDIKKIEEINKTSTRSEPMKLKRPIPIKRTENNLETALGLIRVSKK